MMRSVRSDQKPRPKPSGQWKSWDFEAIGTKWRIELYEPARHVLGLKKKIADRIDEFDKTYSRFRSDSLVSKLARLPGTYEFPVDAEPMFDLYAALYDMTNGRMTPLIGQALVDAGYDADYTLKPKVLQPPPRWDDVLEVSKCTITLKQPALLDLGAAGKGCLVDIVAEMLVQAGARSFCINAGGDIRVQNAKQPVAIGLENPFNPEEAIGIAHLNNHSLCGSAGNRRKWGTYHHIIDPESLASPMHISAVWVSADSTLLADGLATALFFTEPKELMRNYKFDYALMFSDKSIEHSPDFPGYFFIAN